MALATAKRVVELQAVPRSVSFVTSDACLSYVPEFVAKTVSFQSPSSLLLGGLLVGFCGWAGR